jgi:DNA-binding beta-propeller fold protein YncE
MEELMRLLPVTLLLTLALGACDDAGSWTPGSGSRALAALKDGNAAVVGLDDHVVTQPAAPAMAITTDAVFRLEPDALYVVNRFGFDNVVVLDPSTLAVRKQFSTGSGSNPQDVAAAAANRVYVPLYQTGEVLIADPTQPDGAEVVGTIDLKSLDADPSPTAAVLVGDELLVSLAFIDPATYAPKRDAQVAVIDTASAMVTTTIDLPGQNPFARMQRVPGASIVVLDLAADFGGTLGCFATVDVPARAATCAVQNSACGGWSGALWAASTGDVWAAAAAGFQVDGTLCHFTIDGTLLKAGMAVTGSLTDVGVSDRGEVWAVDSKGTGGVWIFDADTDELLTSTPIDLGAAPAFASGVVFLP